MYVASVVAACDSKTGASALCCFQFSTIARRKRPRTGFCYGAGIRRCWHHVTRGRLALAGAVDRLPASRVALAEPPRPIEWRSVSSAFRTTAKASSSCLLWYSISASVRVNAGRKGRMTTLAANRAALKLTSTSLRVARRSSVTHAAGAGHAIIPEPSSGVLCSTALRPGHRYGFMVGQLALVAQARSLLARGRLAAPSAPAQLGCPQSAYPRAACSNSKRTTS